MKRILTMVLIVVSLGIILYSTLPIYQRWKLSKDLSMKVLLVYSPYKTDNNSILKAYSSVLEEEGVSYEKINAYSLIMLKAEETAKTKPVIIFPDGAAQILPHGMTSWINGYLSSGGSIAIIYDAGTKSRKGNFVDNTVFSDIAGINYIQYNQLKKDAFTTGFLKFDSYQKADFLEIPRGKLENDLTLSSYGYGALEYPISRNEIKQDQKINEIAYVVSKDGKRYPAVAIRPFAKGNVLYVNLPLGHLKSNTDDLPMRAILRTFLFKVVRIPHLLNVPYGKGGLVVNWHIDSNDDWEWLPYMIDNGYFRKGIDYSMHVTAGDFRDKPGDGIGFQACGKGRPFILMIKDFGFVGSHGGWGHNWFADNIEKGIFKKDEITKYIKKNNDCLESVTKQKVIEYSAPNGVHPQPVTTEILDKLGVISYYSTGDTGSHPNRSFIANKMVSDKVFAFPVMPFGKYASLYEMKKAGKSENEIKKWFKETVDYIVANRNIRLVYSHPYNIEDYKKGTKYFIDYIEKLYKENKLQVKSMSYFTYFIKRFLNTKFIFEQKDGRLAAHLYNKENLEGITLAVPKNLYKKPVTEKALIQEDKDYYYLVVKDKKNEETFYFDGI
ncbi:MAG: hypothetical protein LLF28_02060 [Nitrospiraceae bacterium]|nr:hypothetical protein [Nitrospiraceae bacterium]